MRIAAVVLLGAFLCAAVSGASTLFRSDPWEYWTDYSDYAQGARIVAHAEVHQLRSPECLTGWEEGGARHAKESFIFADKNQREWFVLDLGRNRPVGRLVVSTALHDKPRIPARLDVYGSTAGPDGPWRRLVENGDPGCRFTYLLDNSESRWLKFDFGECSDAIGSRVASTFGVYKRFILPEAGELIRAFYPKLRRDWPGLEEFWKRIDAADWTGAASALRAYEEKRYEAKGIPPQYKANADLALENKIDFGNDIIFEFCRGIDFDIQPDNSLNNAERGWLHAHLARAYSATGDRRYAAKLVELLESWLEQAPRAPETVSAKYKHWVTLGVAGRAGHWDQILSIIVKDRESFSDKLFANLMYSSWEQYDYLFHAGEEDGNWLAAVTRSALAGGRSWPEYADSRSWVDFARDCFVLNVKRDVYVDGKEFENSSGYVNFAYGMLLGIYDGLKEAGVEIPIAVERRIKLGIDWSTWILQPNGLSYIIGDGNGGCGPMTGVARKLDRPDLLYMCTKGSQGGKPSTNSRHFPVSGWFVMRSDWDERPWEQARHLVFTAAPYGPHGHQDQLSIYCYAYGRTLLSVPSMLNQANYTMPEHWETLRTWSKNTVVVDGASQPFGNEPGVDRRCKNVRWFSSSDIELADATHTMYPEVDHRRRVIFVRGRYWVVIDDLTLKPGADPEKVHTYDQHFHFKDGTDVVVMDHGKVRSNFRNTGNLMLIPLEPERLAASEKTSTPVNYTGCEARTMYGWKYRLEGKGAQRFVTVLYPYPRGPVPRVSVRRLDAVPGVAALEVITPSGRDIICAGDSVEAHRCRHTANACAAVHSPFWRPEGAWYEPRPPTLCGSTRRSHPAN